MTRETVRDVIWFINLFLLFMLASYTVCESIKGQGKSLASFTPLYGSQDNSDERWCGGGVYIADFTILTAAHVWSDTGKLYLDKNSTQPVALIKRDTELDLALLRSPFKGTPAKLGNFRLYDQVLVVGNPFCLDGVVLFGRIGKLNPKAPQMLVGIPAIGGISGGGIFSHGKLVGIANLGFGDNGGKLLIGVTSVGIKAFLEGK